MAWSLNSYIQRERTGLKNTSTGGPTVGVVLTPAPLTTVPLAPEVLSEAERHLVQGHGESTMLRSNKATLQELCQRRQLPTSGTKKDLVKILFLWVSKWNTCMGWC